MAPAVAYSRAYRNTIAHSHRLSATNTVCNARRQLNPRTGY